MSKYLDAFKFAQNCRFSKSINYDITEDKNLSKLSIPEGDGEFLSLHIKDEAMSPTLNLGEWIVCNPYCPIDQITDNGIYVLVTKSNMLVRRVSKITDHQNKITHLKLTADNDSLCSPIFLDRAEVDKIYDVRRKISVLE